MSTTHKRDVEQSRSRWFADGTTSCRPSLGALSRVIRVRAGGFARASLSIDTGIR
jgi:hypothetical protein